MLYEWGHLGYVLFLICQTGKFTKKKKGITLKVNGSKGSKAAKSVFYA